MSDDPRLEAAVDRAVPPVLLRMSAEEREEWGQEKPPRYSINLGLCSGVGKYAVEIAGVMCCPVCSSPIAEGCGTRVDRAERQAGEAAS